MKTWPFLMNPFYYPMLRNLKDASKISEYTDAALLARISDAFFLAQYNNYHPLHTGLVSNYNLWKTQGGVQKGATLSFDQLLALLSPSKINAWDLQVSNVFLPKTPQYMAIFPHGHKPFQKATKDERVNAVEQLYNSLGAYPALSTMRADVNTFHTQLVDARTAQDGNKSQTAGKKDVTTQSVETAAVALYAFLGLCINKYAATPELIESLFDLQSLRNHQQLIFNGKLAGNEAEIIMEHTFTAGDELKIESGSTGITFCLVDSNIPSARTIAPLSVTVSPNSSQVITADKLGSLNNHFLRVVNNEALEGHFRVSLL